MNFSQDLCIAGIFAHLGSYWSCFHFGLHPRSLSPRLATDRKDESPCSCIGLRYEGRQWERR
jgi:hypothetical protein